MIVAMPPVRMVQMAVHQVIDVIAVRLGPNRSRVILSGLLLVGLVGTPVPPSSWDEFGVGSENTTTQGVSQDITRLSCGRHTILLDLHRTTPVGLRGDPIRARVYRDSLEVWSLKEEEVTKVECRSLTGDGVPGLILTTYSLGAHCCTGIYVLSLTSEPKLLLQCDEGNGEGYQVRDLKADGSLQLILNDDSFAYFGGLSYASSPSRLPLVACYGDGSFEDCTKEFPGVVRDSIAAYRAELKDSELRIKSGEITASPGWPTDFSIAGSVLGIYANFALLGQDAAGWAVVRPLVRSERVLKWFECNRPTVQRWARHREEILHDSKLPSHEIWNTPGCEEWEPGRAP